MRFLVRTVCTIPPQFPADRRADLVARERERSRELSESGKLVAQWKVPVQNESVTVWEVADPNELHEIIMSLPAAAWARSTATPLIDRNLQQHAKR